jgi:DNA polymerase-3 subunit epsilon
LHPGTLALIRRALVVARAETAAAGPRDLVVIDTETTGCSRTARLVEIAAIHARDGVAVREFRALVHPGVPIPRAATRIHGITDAMVRDAPPARAVLPAFLAFVGSLPLVAHNAPFDRGILTRELARAGLAAPGVPVYCTLRLARRVITDAASHGLQPLARHLGIVPTGAHRALDDARTALGVLNACLARRPSVGLDALHGAAKTL